MANDQIYNSDVPPNWKELPQVTVIHHGHQSVTFAILEKTGRVYHHLCCLFAGERLEPNHWVDQIPIEEVTLVPGLEKRLKNRSLKWKADTQAHQNKLRKPSGRLTGRPRKRNGTNRPPWKRSGGKRTRPHRHPGSSPSGGNPGKEELPVTQNSLETFERDLEFKGCGYAPNGARYLLTHYGPQDQPSCERTHQGKREIILGLNGETFGSLDAARAWAGQDGRREISDRPFNERKLLA
jgi:hypothetical protein